MIMYPFLPMFNFKKVVRIPIQYFCVGLFHYKCFQYFCRVNIPFVTGREIR